MARSRAGAGKDHRDSPAAHRARTVQGRGGLALPVALLIVLALGLLSTALLVVAYTEREMSLQVLEYLRARVRAADPPTGAVATERDGWTETALPGGFVLLEEDARRGATARFAVRWRLRPDSVLATLPGAVQTSVAPSEDGIQALPGCSSARSRALIRVGGGASGAAAPALGPIQAGELSPLATVELEDGDSFPGGVGTGTFRIIGPASLEAGEASGLLVARGDLVIRGSARFVGLVLVEGGLRLEDRAQLEGVLLARTLQLSDDARVFGCPASVRAALELPELDRSYPVRGGENLGRF